MVSELSSLRPASTEFAMADVEPIHVMVGKSFKEVRKKVGNISDLQSFIIQHFNLPHIQLVEGSNGAIIMENLFDGVPENVESQDHESFDEISKLLCWISGSIELPKRSDLVAPKVFDESSRAVEENSDQHVHDEFQIPLANSGQTPSMLMDLDEISACDMRKEADLLTDVELKIDGTLISDQKLVQFEANLEPNSDAYHLFDEMPMRMASHEITFDAPMLSGAGSFVAMLNQPNLLTSKSDHDKVNPKLRNLVLKTYANSIACLELHYFDPGGVLYASIDVSLSIHASDLQDSCAGMLAFENGNCVVTYLLKSEALIDVNKNGEIVIFDPGIEEFTFSDLNLSSLNSRQNVMDACFSMKPFEPGEHLVGYGSEIDDHLAEVSLSRLQSVTDLSENGEMIFDPGGNSACAIPEKRSIDYVLSFSYCLKPSKEVDWIASVLLNPTHVKALLDVVNPSSSSSYCAQPLRKIIRGVVKVMKVSLSARGMPSNFKGIWDWYEKAFAEIELRIILASGCNAYFAGVPPVLLPKTSHCLHCRRNNPVKTGQGLIACIGENELTFTNCAMCLIHGDMFGSLIHLIYFRIIINEVVTLMLGVPNMHAQWTVLLTQAAYENGLTLAIAREMQFDCAGNNTVRYFNNLKMQKHYFTEIDYPPAYMQVIRSSYSHACIYDMDFMFIDCDLLSGIENNIYGSSRHNEERHWNVLCGGPCFGDAILVLTEHDWHTSPVYASPKANSQDTHLKASNIILIFDPGGDSSKLTTEGQCVKCQVSMEFYELLIIYKCLATKAIHCQLMLAYKSCYQLILGCVRCQSSLWKKCIIFEMKFPDQTSVNRLDKKGPTLV